ncbi:kinase-like domain-containing protein [Lactarius quietus]|nr:kinase-like domain-containing protein [Lactarius quietus]
MSSSSSSTSSSASQYVGETLDNGILRIECILGEGAFGIVYRAVDTVTGVHYAVKCVEKTRPGHYHTREEQLHAREGPYVFYVYDLCAGDLHSVIKKVTFFREDELIKRVFVQIIDAVEHCHSRGVYHRDLKPENILVSAKSGDIDVFVADFGLATTKKMTRSSCGTPCFMGPESLVPDHQPYSTVHGDIWALGSILAEMIANMRPWWVATPEDSDYSDYLMDRTVLFDMLPVSDSAYQLLRKIFSPKPERRPSLATIRAEVLAMDTFFLTDKEAAKYGWVDRLEKQKMRKMRASGMKTSTSSGSSESCSLGSSSASRNSTGSSSSAFDSSSAESSELPATPPAPAAEVVCIMDKISRVVLAPRVAVAQSI